VIDNNPQLKGRITHSARIAKFPSHQADDYRLQNGLADVCFSPDASERTKAIFHKVDILGSTIRRDGWWGMVA